MGVPVAALPEQPSSKPQLARYRTLLTGNTVIDGSPSKANSRATSKANSRATSPASRASAGKDGTPSHRGAATPRSPRTPCRAGGKEAENLDVFAAGDGLRQTELSFMAGGQPYDPAAADQPGGVLLEDMLLGVKLATLACVGGEGASLEPGLQEALEAVAGGSHEAQKPLQQLLEGLGFCLDRSFCHGVTVAVRGFIAHSEDDVVLAYGGAASQAGIQGLEAAGLAEFGPLVEAPQGLLGMAECCLFEGCNSRVPRAHEGLLNAFTASVHDIDAVLRPMLQASRPLRLIVAGHGTGGALATGALAYLLKGVDFARTPHRVLFVTTGQPRFGDGSFRAWLEAEVQRLGHLGKCGFARLVGEADPMPAAPQGSAALVHVGRPWLLTRTGELLLAAEGAASLAEGPATAVPVHAEVEAELSPAKYLQRLSAQVRGPAALAPAK